MTAEDPLVVFTPSGRRGRMAAGSTVLEAARTLAVDLDSVCGGRGICGRCQVTQSIGEFAKHGISSTPDHLGAWTETEETYRGKRGLGDGRRLGCAAAVLGDVVIDVPAESQVHRQVVRKRAEVHAIDVDPVVRLYYVEVAEPDMHDPTGDAQRLLAALHDQWELTGLTIDSTVLREVQPALRRGQWTVTVAVHDGATITAVWPGFRDTAFGIAVDIGSTTIAGHLCDLFTGEVRASAGVMNPQIRFGEDLMSRVSYVMMNPGGDAELTAAVRDALDGLIGELAAEAGIDRRDVLELTFVGNPIMHHLFLGLDPTELGGAPFALATDAAVRLPARELGLACHPGARVYVLPCIAGHVGADTAGAMLSEAPHRSAETQLLVDVGTNAEIVLGNRDRLLAASSPTGPAFEGAQISSGTRAAVGAIERVRIDADTLEPRYQVIGSDLWSDDPEFAAEKIDIIGVCGSGIIEVIAELFLAGVIRSDGTIDPAAADRNPRVIADGRTASYVLRDAAPRLLVTQNDVRAIQLAKAALYAGAKLLMDHLGVDRVDQIRLAGAFGSHIDTTYAMVLGLIPDCDLERVSAAGNAAGVGAVLALLSGASRAEVEGLVRKVEKIETAVEPRFQEHFVDAMALPHATADYPELARVVTLPARTEPATPERRRRRRRPDHNQEGPE